MHCDAYVPLGFIPIPKIYKSRVKKISDGLHTKFLHPENQLDC